MRTQLFQWAWIILLACACSSDGSGDEGASAEPSFSFTITGDGETRTITGSGIVFNSNFTDVKDFEGNNTTLNTVLVIALDASQQGVEFGITFEGSVTKGTHQIGTDLLTFYNAFLNYYRDHTTKKFDFQSDSGTITLTTVDPNTVAGTLSVQASGNGTTVTITGKFTAKAF